MDPHSPLISSSPVSTSSSPPLRSTILGSFLGRANRTRNASAGVQQRDGRELSPPVEALGLPRAVAIPTPVTPASNHTPILTTAHPPTPIQAQSASPTSPSFRLRLVPHLESRRSLRFEVITRDMRVGDPVLRIGRFTDRSGQNATGAAASANNNPASFKVAFKSKVVSRTHAELWVELSSEGDSGSPPQPKFFVRDTSSSSGTFLNHVRLSAANTPSRPVQVRDGDILQLGVDYQGGSEDIYKCVKIRVEVGRDWMMNRNEYNAVAMKNLKSIAQSVDPTTSVGPSTSGKKKGKGSGLPDCCICLYSLTPFQPLFVSSCSHTFHYKCIRPLIEKHYPGFCCPLCRTYADLEEDVEIEREEDDEEVEDDEDHEVEVEIDEEELLAVNTRRGEIDGEGGGHRGSRGADIDVDVLMPDEEGVAMREGDFHEEPHAEEEEEEAAGGQRRRAGTADQRHVYLGIRGEAQYGGETEVESDFAGAGAGGSAAVRSVRRRGQGQGRGRGHARNTSLSAQIDPMPATHESMDEDGQDQEWENEDEVQRYRYGEEQVAVEDTNMDVIPSPVEGDHHEFDGGMEHHDRRRRRVSVMNVDNVYGGGEDDEIQFVGFGEGAATATAVRERGQSAVGGVGAREKRK
ncbi:hypothetical protein D9757_000358 [Collybiopsis confluens]|uniref:Uncharacterized protein n=1 Tax=Collybiopsis confluens TaxID=2823264 RepID=A0A8H5MGT7_9AGAR|nr:hypothetical protein D9757_000358 [Collybiopsis confluens]